MDQEFDKEVKEFFDRLLERQPVLATALGVHTYDHLLPDGTRKATLEMIDLLKGIKETMAGFEPSTLSEERRLDRELGLYLANLWIYEMEEIRMWEKSSEVADTIGGGLFLLFTRDFAPLEHRMKSIAARLEAAPRFMRESKELLVHPSKLWNQIALESGQRFPLFVQVILGTAKQAITDEELVAGLEEKATNAIQALDQYNQWLRDEIIPSASEKYVIGKEKFDELIRLRELGLTSRQILALGEKYLKEMKKQRESLAKKINAAATVKQVLEQVKSKHPATFQGALDKYRQTVTSARQFVLEHDLATFPEGEELAVIETPSYLRHIIPFAAYNPPGKFDKKQTGIYIVTPVEDKPQMLKEHSFASIENTSVHEAYPGHHLQLVCANTNPSLVRLLSQGTEFVEGWAFYTEELMKQLGYADTPENRLIMMNDLIWRAVRIIVDVRLSSGEMTYEEAINFLMEETGMERPAAEAEVKRYTMTPGQALSYLLGKHLIMDLVKEMKTALGEEFDLKLFHDMMLYAGSLPMKFMKRLVKEKLTEIH